MAETNRSSKKKKSLIVLSSPSGGGKTTVAKHILKKFPSLSFSISATTRSARPGEKNGVDYYFYDKTIFEKMIAERKLLEYESIFGNYYGTPIEEVEMALAAGRAIIFDIDVKGAFSIRKAYPEESLLIFISPPSMEELAKRLRNRHTESAEQMSIRLARAEMEMAAAKDFDHIIINNELERTFTEAEELVGRYL